LVLERLSGETLEARLLRAPLSPVLAARVGVAVADALGAVHAAGIIHRDVKPANVFLCDEAADERVKLIDFGIAKVLGERALTRTGTLVGTPVYMAPEQLREETVDARTDVYGLGASLYEALSGRPPFVSAGAKLMKDVLVGELVPIAELVVGIDPELASIVHKALAKDPALRFESAQAMRDRLADWLQIASNRKLPALAQTVDARPASTRRTRGRASRWPWVVVAAIVVSAPVAAGVVAYASRPSFHRSVVLAHGPPTLAPSETASVFVVVEASAAPPTSPVPAAKTCACVRKRSGRVAYVLCAELQKPVCSCYVGPNVLCQVTHSMLAGCPAGKTDFGGAGKKRGDACKGYAPDEATPRDGSLVCTLCDPQHPTMAVGRVPGTYCEGYDWEGARRAGEWRCK
jgi:hypothetical protein